MKHEATKPATTASAPSPIAIKVSDVEALYAAVNNPNNAGKTIVLKPGPYVLTRHRGTQERVNKGRLELQTGHVAARRGQESVKVCARGLADQIFQIST